MMKHAFAVALAAVALTAPVAMGASHREAPLTALDPTIDNTDIKTHTWQGFDDYFVVDARVNYRITENWSASLAVDDLNNDRYFLFHPFPQRTVTAELKYSY